MNVQELFEQADPEIVFYAYTLLEPVFSDYDERSIAEQAHIYRGLKGHIEKYCDKLANVDLDYSCEPMTIFVLGMRDTSWGCSYKKDIRCHVIKDSEAFEGINKKFTLWNDNGEIRIEHYGIDFVELSELASYSVAEESIEQLGADVCCATILQDLFEWGLTEESRSENHDDLIEKLAESEKDIEEGRCYSADEVFEELEKKYFSELLTEDEKEHRRLEKEYKNKVREIESRHSSKIIDEDHQMFIEAVRSEYQRRSWL